MVDRGRLDFCKDLSFVDPRIRPTAPSDKMELLDPEYEPGYWDVICQGGKDSYDHIGNRRFRVCIDNNLGTYMKANTKHEKSMVVTVIVDAVRESSTQSRGGFVRKDLMSGRWYEVGDKVAREKVGHALRDSIKLRDKLVEIPTTPELTLSGVKTVPLKRRRIGTLESKPSPVSDDSGSSSSDSGIEAVTSSNDRSINLGHLALHNRASLNLPLSRVTRRPVGSVTASQSDWEISLKESTEHFQASDDESQGENEPGRDKRRKRNHDSTTMAASKVPASIPKVSWKPPGDAGLEDEFEVYMKGLDPTPIQLDKDKQSVSCQPQKMCGQNMFQHPIGGNPKLRAEVPFPVVSQTEPPQLALAALLNTGCSPPGTTHTTQWQMVPGSCGVPGSSSRNPAGNCLGNPVLIDDL